VRFCPDANALIAWLLQSERTDTVDEFWSGLRRDDEIVAAQLLIPETASGLREKAFTKEIDHSEASRLLQELLALPITLISDPRQFSMAMEIANRTNHRKSYDMQYVAVAELEGCEMVTLDGGVYQAAIERGIPARLLR